MINKLSPYLPPASVEAIFELIKHYQVHLKIVNERVTRHGDYTRTVDRKHIITVNANLNPYRFLMTLVHEIAHLVAYQKYGGTIKPHGIEWKKTFQLLMLPFLNPSVYPNELLPLLANHFKNPSASSDTDERLSIAMKRYDQQQKDQAICYVYEIPLGSHFETQNGRIFKRGPIRIKRFECLEVRTGKLYTFKANAEVRMLTHYVAKQ